MKLCFILSTCLITFTIGCGKDDVPQPERMESFITIIDESGTEREIPSSTLIDKESGKPAAKQILVVDRQSNRKKFMDVSQWQEQSPSQMRYVPVMKESAKSH